MKNKIFKSIFVAIMIALVCSSAIFFVYFYSILSRVSGVDYDAWDLLIETIAPMLGLIIVMALLAPSTV